MLLCIFQPFDFCNFKQSNKSENPKQQISLFPRRVFTQTVPCSLFLDDYLLKIFIFTVALFQKAHCSFSKRTIAFQKGPLFFFRKDIVLSHNCSFSNMTPALFQEGQLFAEKTIVLFYKNTIVVLF